MKQGDLNVFGMLISAMVTPFLESGEIDYACVSQLIKQMEETKHDSIVVAGSTGEGHSLSIEEKLALFQYVKSHTKLKVIYSISQNSILNLKKEMEQIDPLEPDGYLMVVPYYNLPPQRGIYLFFKEAASYTKRPIIIYNVPSRTNSHIEFTTLRKLIKSTKNIVGIKEASSDVNFISLLKKNFPQFLCYAGSDREFYSFISHGADGIISVMSILYGKEMRQLYDDYKEGYHALLLDDYLKLVAELLSLETNPIPIKYLLSQKGYPSMHVRLPLVELSSEFQREMNLLL